MGTPRDFAWLLDRPIERERTGDARFPYRARMDGLGLDLYSGDWSSENPYTLYVDGTPAFGIGDFPSARRVPSS